jgi:hypothetical protein
MPKWGALLAGLACGVLIALICAYGEAFATAAAGSVLLDLALRPVMAGSYAVWPFVVATAALSGLVLVALDRSSRPFRGIAFAAVSGATLVAFVIATIVRGGLNIPSRWLGETWWETVCSAAGESPLLVFTTLVAGYASARARDPIRRVYSMPASTTTEEH